MYFDPSPSNHYALPRTSGKFLALRVVATAAVAPGSSSTVQYLLGGWGLQGMSGASAVLASIRSLRSTHGSKFPSLLSTSHRWQSFPPNSPHSFPIGAPDVSGL